MSKLHEILDDILVEAEAATEEPWKSWRSINGGGSPLRLVCAGENVDKDRVCKVKSFVGEKNKGTQNAAFIAHARTNVPRMAKALLRVENMAQESRKRFAEGCKIVELMTIIDEATIDILAILKGDQDDNMPNA